MNLRLTSVSRLAAAAFTLIVLGLLAGVVGTHRAERGETVALQRQATLSAAAAHFDTASDRLSRDARLFTLTGRRSYARDYWRQVRAGQTRSEALDRLASLSPSTRAGELLRLARGRSSRLVERELHAMRLVFAAQGAPTAAMPLPVAIASLGHGEWRLDAAAQVARARRLVLGSSYIDAKRLAAVPVRSFEQLGARRANGSANAAQRTAEAWATALVLLVSAFVLLGAGLLWFVHGLVARPVARYAAALQGHGSGTAAALEPRGVEELRLLAAGFNEQLQSSRQALTDELTGLGNRRLLMRDLAAAPAGPAPPPTLFVLYDLDGFKLYNDTHGHPAGDALLERLGRRLEQAVAGRGSAYRLGGDEFCILAGAGGDEPALLERLAGALCEESGGVTVRPSFGIARLPDEAGDAAAALSLADQRMYAHKEERRRSAPLRGRDLLLRLLDEQPADLHLNTAKVAELAAAVAHRLGVPPAERARIVQAAELHDIGKVAIPAEILRKPGPLLPAEWTSMRTHSVIGERILAALPSLAAVAPLVRASHERYDGGGYPDGLAGEEIPLGARIVAVCDAFDAMTSERSYRGPRTAADALLELERCAGSQFDPRAVAALCAEIAPVPRDERRAA